MYVEQISADGPQEKKCKWSFTYEMALILTPKRNENLKNPEKPHLTYQDRLQTQNGHYNL